MSVFVEALPVVQFQVFGLSVHFKPPLKIWSAVLSKASTKRKDRNGSSGVPAAFKTLRPLPDAMLVFAVQSPMPVNGELARRSPSIPKPPEGGVIGAKPP